MGMSQGGMGMGMGMGMGQGGMGAGQGGMGMGQGGMGGAGPMSMAGGMMRCPMMKMMMGARAGMEMPGAAGGAAMLYGMPPQSQPEMTPAMVQAMLEQRLVEHGNPRLKLGAIATAADGSITAEIVTVDDSLVQKLVFNRYPGLVRQVVE